MNIETKLRERSDATCELCASTEDLLVYEVSEPPADAENHILICATCKEQIVELEKTDPNHWRCLNDSMWSPVPPVQVMARRRLATGFAGYDVHG